MRLIAKLHVPITGLQVRRLQSVGAKLLFCSAHAGVVGLEMEEGSLLNQFDFILGWRPSRKGQVLFHPALEAENIEARPAWKPMHLQPVFNPQITQITQIDGKEKRYRTSPSEIRSYKLNATCLC